MQAARRVVVLLALQLELHLRVWCGVVEAFLESFCGGGYAIHVLACYSMVDVCGA